MGLYLINNIAHNAKYKEYNDVVRVFAKQKKGLISSIFSSAKEFIFIISTESPIMSKICIGKECEIDEKQFRDIEMSYTDYKVEIALHVYEERKSKRIAEERKKAWKESHTWPEKNGSNDKSNKANKDSTDTKQPAENKGKSEDKNNVLKSKEQNTIKLDDVIKSFESSKATIIDENSSFSDKMAALAGNVNLCFINKDNNGFNQNFTKLYNNVLGYNSHKLKSIEAKHGQTVGLAFIKIALYVNYRNDFNVNEIAAQNAYYCIAKSYIEAKNSTAIPALFTLLLKKPKTLLDELYDLNPDPSLSGLGGLVPTAQMRKEGRALDNRLPLLKFLLSKFYNEETKKFKIDPSIPYHIPKQEDINKFYSELKDCNIPNNNDLLKKGEYYFNNT